MKKFWPIAMVLVVAAMAPTRRLIAEDKPAKWLALPADICAVLLGPDQRRWSIETLEEMKPTDLDAVKQCIASQWNKPAPELRDCWPVLFEKKGAIWFVTRDLRKIVRYDGAAWIEQDSHVPAKVRGGFTGMAPGRTNDGLMGHNAEVGDIRVFLESSGACAFDGAAWKFQPFPNGGGPYGYSYEVRTYPEKDGKGVLVLQTNPAALLRFREGQWSRVVLPGKTLALAVMPDGGVWAALPQAHETQKLVRIKLKGESPAISNTFTWATIKGHDLSPFLKTMWQSDAGTVYAECWVPREVLDPGQGQLVITPDGNSKFLPENAALFRMPMDPEGHVWSTGWLNAWVECLDPTKDYSDRVVHMIHGMHYLQALAADGTAYASYSDPLDWRFKTKPPVQGVVAYCAAGHENRQILQLKPVETTYENVAVDDDGTLYAAAGGQGLSRFNGKEFEPEKAQGIDGGILIPGHAGVMLRWSMTHGDTFSISDGTHVAQGGDLARLVEENRNLFVKGFTDIKDPAIWDEPLRRFRVLPRDFAGWTLAVDKQGRVWIAFERKLRVLGSDGKWIDVKWPVPDPHNGPTLVTPVGDGETMYVTNAVGMNYDVKSKKAYVVKLDGDKAAWTEVPVAQRVWRQSNGDLIAVRARQVPGKNGQNPTHENVAAVIGADGAGADCVLPGIPVLLDKSDYLWVSEETDNAYAGARFKLWKDGVVAGEAYVPGLCDGIATDAVGSIWVMAAGTLQHLVAEDPSKPADYRVKESCVLMANQHELPLLQERKGLVAWKDGLLVKWGTGERNAKGHTDPHFWVAVVPFEHSH